MAAKKGRTGKDLPVDQIKKKYTVRILPAQIVWLKNKPNQAEYIGDLIAREMRKKKA